MRTRIEICDTRIENAVDTVSAEINPPAPLAIAFAYDGATARSYMEYDTGLLELMKNICKNNRFVRKLKIEIELENEEGDCDA